MFIYTICMRTHIALSTYSRSSTNFFVQPEQFVLTKMHVGVVETFLRLSNSCTFVFEVVTNHDQILAQAEIPITRSTISQQSDINRFVDRDWLS
jgi:hypothetical protein